MSEVKDEGEDPTGAPAATMGELFDDLEELEAMVDDPAAREQIGNAMQTAEKMGEPGTFGRVIRGYDLADLSEAFLGALLLGIPMFVEGGTYEIGGFLARRPLLLLGTHGITIGLVYAILYVAEFQDVRVKDPLLGFIPKRMVGVLGASLVTATVIMTLWGTIQWARPMSAIAAITVAHLPMSIGAAIGDILPGT